MTKASPILLFLSALLLLACSYLFLIYRQEARASIGADAYVATSTAASAFFGSQTASTLIRSGPGTFGSFIVEGAAAGVVNVYDATTTDKNKRTGNTATSSILIASFPASLAEGTYTFDAQFATGLLVDLYAGTMPTSTVTYK